MTCLFFGCWNEAGHYLFGPGKRRDLLNSHNPVYYGDHRHIDSTLAPRLLHGKIIFDGQFPKNVRGNWECPQGQFLRHELDNGFTAIQWWDRQQGDTRSACNSTILLEGKHSTETMLAAATQHFPHVLANLEKAGIKLVEVFL